MGITGLARWPNSSQRDFESVCQRVIRNGGAVRGRWTLYMRSYRYISPANSFAHRSDRMMHAINVMGPDPCTYVWLEDGSRPLKGEYEAALATAGRDGVSQSKSAMQSDEESPHFRTTFITLKPPQSIDLLLISLRAPWVPGRQGAGPQDNTNRAWQSGAPHLMLEGYVFHLGSDWVVRAGNLSSATGGPKGMLLEAEYLPLTHMPSRDDGDTTKLNTFLSSFLATLFPSTPNARRTLVSLEENLWVEASAEDIFEGLYNVVDEKSDERDKAAKQRGPAQHEGVSGADAEHTEATVEANGPAKEASDAQGAPEKDPPNGDAADDVPMEEELEDEDWVYGTNTAAPPNRLDWIGAERERRSAFSIIAVLRKENVL